MIALVLNVRIYKCSSSDRGKCTLLIVYFTTSRVNTNSSNAPFISKEDFMIAAADDADDADDAVVVVVVVVVDVIRTDTHNVCNTLPSPLKWNWN